MAAGILSLTLIRKQVMDVAVKSSLGKNSILDG